MYGYGATSVQKVLHADDIFTCAVSVCVYTEIPNAKVSSTLKMLVKKVFFQHHCDAKYSNYNELSWKNKLKTSLNM